MPTIQWVKNLKKNFSHDHTDGFSINREFLVRTFRSYLGDRIIQTTANL
ncbi:MAG: hypothetical protein JOY62_03945 [Acidobacteriaceae bacterium]|nr:hypothetical protein [Acidobacteriaceae bacterium]MBV9779104.1 hypothetical protein [Acidobacteriaceae bacterium]